MPIFVHGEANVGLNIPLHENFLEALWRSRIFIHAKGAGGTGVGVGLGAGPQYTVGASGFNEPVTAGPDAYFSVHGEFAVAEGVGGAISVDVPIVSDSKEWREAGRAAPTGVTGAVAGRAAVGEGAWMFVAPAVNVIFVSQSPKEVIELKAERILQQHERGTPFLPFGFEQHMR